MKSLFIFTLFMMAIPLEAYSRGACVHRAKPYYNVWTCTDNVVHKKACLNMSPQNDSVFYPGKRCSDLQRLNRSSASIAAPGLFAAIKQAFATGYATLNVKFSATDVFDEKTDLAGTKVKLVGGAFLVLTKKGGILEVSSEEAYLEIENVTPGYKLLPFQKEILHSATLGAEVVNFTVKGRIQPYINKYMIWLQQYKEFETMGQSGFITSKSFIYLRNGQERFSLTTSGVTFHPAMEQHAVQPFPIEIEPSEPVEIQPVRPISGFPITIN